eukprot:9514078-Heterocapsa_arctica.AAC.1
MRPRQLRLGTCVSSGCVDCIATDIGHSPQTIQACTPQRKPPTLRRDPVRSSAHQVLAPQAPSAVPTS